MKNVPAFTNPKISESINKLSPKLETFTSSLDVISNDIKTLEKWLQATGFCYPCECVFSETNESEKVSISESVAWRKAEESNTWRIMYLKEKVTMIGKDVYGERQYARSVLESKPLIEVGAEIRIDAYETLPSFIDNISDSKALNIERVNLPQ